MRPFATNLIINGPKIGGSWDKIIRDCERAIETVKPGSKWIRRGHPERAARIVARVERYSLYTSGRRGGRDIGLTKVVFKPAGEKGVRGDVFLKDFVRVED